MGGLTQEQWETLTSLPHDSYLAFADGELLAARHEQILREVEVDLETGALDGTASGKAAIAMMTQADEDVPVEVQRDAQGRVDRVRLCWTYDVDELESAGEGAWETIADLPLPSGKCLAWDPRDADPEDRIRIDVVEGTYRCESFNASGDHLGLRITLRAG